MPKTKITYNNYQGIRFSDKGAQMLENLWRLDKSDSKASFVRDAVVFYMNNAMPKETAELWNNENVPEIVDFAKSKETSEIKNTKKSTKEHFKNRGEQP